MATFEDHRRRLAVWKRPLVAVPAVLLLLSPYVVQTRLAHPDRFWGAVALVGFFALWAVGRVVWHYSILRAAPAVDPGA